MPSNLADPVATALRGGPLTATGVLLDLRSPHRSPEVTVGRLFWTLDGLIAGGAVHQEVDRCGERRYRLIGSGRLAALPDRAVVRPVELDSGSNAASPFHGEEQHAPDDGQDDVRGVRFRGSLSIATARLSLRARLTFVATSRSQGRHRT